MFDDSVDTKPEAQSDRVVVAPKLVKMAEVVWVHPQSKLVGVWVVILFNHVIIMHRHYIRSMKLVSILSCHGVVTSLEEVEMVKYTNALLTCRVKKKSSALPIKLKRRYYIERWLSVFIIAYVCAYFQKPLNRPQNQALFDKICKLQNEKHFVIIHAYLVSKLSCIIMLYTIS